MQVKNNEHRAAVEHDPATTAPAKIDPVAESNKTQDVHKQAEHQQDKGKNWEKFAASPSAQPPANINANKQVEASQEISRADIEAKLREHTIKA
jgi:hypothetical protein